MSQKRVLAAIMFTDIKGYTALMQQDESIAVALKNKHREIFEHTTSAFHGEVLQYFGDGTLSVFKSTVEAVECAIEMQLAFITAEIPVRIGIHVGDIMYSEEDIVGDAVNVASRIESCAIPGSILISDKVHDQIRSHRHIEAKFLDAYEFKNVDGAIPLFAISNSGLAIPDPADIKGKLKDAKEAKTSSVRVKKSYLWIGGLILLGIILFLAFSIKSFKITTYDNSIAVLPFDNLSTDEDSEIFRDGMTEDILAYLSKINDLHVISRTSVMQYKNTDKGVPEIAKELGVSYIVEGSIRKYGDKVRVTAQLIEAGSDKRIWSESYDKILTDIFEIQSEISQEIADELELNISFDEQQNLAVIPTQNIEAYKLYLQGRNEADKRNAESIAKSIELYREALLLDPSYAEVYAEMANSIYLETYYSGRDHIEASKTANGLLDEAEQIDNRVARIYSVRGLIYNIEGKKEEARKAFERAIKLSPNDRTARQQFATFYYYNQEYDKQLEQAEMAYRLDPLSFATANSYFTALVESQKYDEAEKLMQKVEQRNDSNNKFVINRSYFRLYTAKGDYKKTIVPLLKLAGEEPVFYRFLAYSYGQVGDTLNAHRVIDTIRSIEFDLEDGKSHQLAIAFAGLKETDSVYHYLDTIRNKRTDMLRRELNGFFEFIKKDPRYEGLMEAHGLTPN